STAQPSISNAPWSSCSASVPRKTVRAIDRTSSASILACQPEEQQASQRQADHEQDRNPDQQPDRRAERPESFERRADRGGGVRDGFLRRVSFRRYWDADRDHLGNQIERHFRRFQFRDRLLILPVTLVIERQDNVPGSPRQ